MGEGVKGSSPDFKDIINKYAEIQTEAYTSQSAKKEDIEALKQDLTSYFEDHPSSDQSHINEQLDYMADEAQKHQDDKSHTDNSHWDETREDLDGLIKSLAPKGTDTSAIDNIPKGGDSGASGGSGGASGGTQDFVKGGASSGGAAGTFHGVQMVSFDDMISKFPQLAKYKDVLQNAADKYGIPVQMLAAQAMQESHANPSEKGGGMFQFIPSTWASMGQGGYDFNEGNVGLQAEMAAKYDAQLLQQHNGDLNSMLREYNGPVSDKGIPEYQADIMRWMRGIDGYTG